MAKITINTPAGPALITFHHKGQQYIGDVVLPGGRRFGVIVPLDDVRREVISLLSNRVGWGWGSIKKAAGKIAKKVAIKKIASAAYNVSKRALPMAKVLSPQLGLSISAVQRVTGIVQRAKAGSPKDRRQLAVIRRSAQDGNPTAAKLGAAAVIANQNLLTPAAQSPAAQSYAPSSYAQSRPSEAAYDDEEEEYVEADQGEGPPPAAAPAYTANPADRSLDEADDEGGEEAYEDDAGEE